MHSLIVCLVAVVGFATPPTVKTALIQPRVLAGLEIQVGPKNQLTVMPGVCRVDDSAVRVVKAVTLNVMPADEVAVTDEQYVLSDEFVERWAKGTHLRGCAWSDKGTTIPDVLVIGFVIVKRGDDGAVMKEGADYHVDTKWAGVQRVDGGQIPKGAKVKISYRVGLSRLDGIDIASDGKVTLSKGAGSKSAPLPPALTKGALRLANVYVPGAGAAADLQPWQVYVVGEPFREPEDHEIAGRAMMVEKTLRKLRSGQPVTIVAWGDSVTAGGDASSADKAFPQLFATKLQERFGKSKVKLVNAGIGATNTATRIGAFAKEVIAHQPDLVTIEFVNDMLLPAETTRKNLQLAFEQTRAVGGEVILITPHFVMPEMMHHEHPRGPETRPLVPLLRDIASDSSVGLADVSRRWEHLEREGLPYITLLKNGINHPDDRGHELFVRELMTFFPAE